MKQYKHKQTGIIAVEDSKTGIYHALYDESKIPIIAEFLENTQDWELIPETPEMEVVEGKCFIEEDVMEDTNQKYVFSYLYDDTSYKAFLKTYKNILMEKKRKNP